jgi:diacylglycerol kinase family enzyme
VQCDGEIIGETPKRIRILPGALNVVVPVTATAAAATQAAPSVTET